MILYHSFTYLLKLLFQILFISEIIFYIFIKFLVFYKLKNLTKPLKYEEESKNLIYKILKCNNKLEIYDSQLFISGWFCGSSLRDIKYQNALEFFSWAMYAKYYKDINSKQKDIVIETVNYVKIHLNLPLEDGYNPNVKHIHMTLEPFHYLHRPLLLYIIVAIKNIFTGIALRAMGYKKYTFHSISYWYRPSRTSQQQQQQQQQQQNNDNNNHDNSHSKKKKNIKYHQHHSHNNHPTIFFHGITTGWAPYAILIEYLNDDRTVILFNLDSIQLHSLNFNHPSPDLYSYYVKSILDLHGITRVNIVSHSYGTITTGWFVKRYPSYTAHITLIDPVSLLLSQPSVAYNFLYRKPSNLMQWILYLGASSEITIAYVLRRQFWWYCNQLWLEDIDKSIGVHVSLAGKDEIADSSIIREYLIMCIKERNEYKQQQQQQQQQRNSIENGENEHYFPAPFSPTQSNARSPSKYQRNNKNFQSNDNSYVENNLPIADITYCYRETDSHAQILLSAKCLKKLANDILKGQKNAFWKDDDEYDESDNDNDEDENYSDDSDNDLIK